ncbi:hypothetical protein [Burkholderia dolosa]|uniref:hypothetical protein n=1 Tax=Burkholderia dolosa TaxID=152500 RepID=UPI0015907F21|nr:hypothetical protein [Burkholderia dolosa]MBR8304435.1 hypothetical protein [Burkholderia dolosa]MBR8315626.1 hypothetical protein [Burkholderia dolosa]MBR8458689.1 hypothetical protein [Burkholderia dolosa]MBY4752785.1 hypothetical protein [Burkholderia dolosa]MBY4831379.1 hypothetical protein [Burkholderia dolosa]
MFRYGSGQTRQYEAIWQPAGSPTYSRLAASNISREQFAAFTMTYCSTAANDTPARFADVSGGMTRRNDEVDGSLGQVHLFPARSEERHDSVRAAYPERFNIGV